MRAIDTPSSPQRLQPGTRAGSPRARGGGRGGSGIGRNGGIAPGSFKSTASGELHSHSRPRERRDTGDERALGSRRAKIILPRPISPPILAIVGPKHSLDRPRYDGQESEMVGPQNSAK
jgi:hypothetical protein